MVKRKVITIDDLKCNGCGLCIPNCPEGAIQIIDQKARLISDLFCDGLGACIGHCPQGAISIEERDAKEYDERKVMENIVRQGENVIHAHLTHLEAHGETGYLRQARDYLKENGIALPRAEREVQGPAVGNCPGLSIMDLRKNSSPTSHGRSVTGIQPELQNWPVQIKLVPVSAPYFQGAQVLFAADCVPFSYADFHQDLLKGKVLLIGCPKLDDAAFYQEKITQILKLNTINAVTCVHMEVPCCFGLVHIVKSAIAASGKDIPYQEITISIKGERLDDREVSWSRSKELKD